MKYEYNSADTESWILLFLHKRDWTTIDEIVEKGCRFMILDQGYDKLRDILSDLTINKYIKYDAERYKLDIKGIFKINQDVFIPLFKLDPTKLTSLADQLEDSCDVALIRKLDESKNMTKKYIESMITEYGLSAIPLLNILLQEVLNFVAQHPIFNTIIF